MTNKQAIDLIHACMHMNNAEILEARDKACIALEKQIPKKPIRIKDNMVKDCEWIVCPNCKQKITNSITFAKLNYTPEYWTCCGQALDWSEIK